MFKKSIISLALGIVLIINPGLVGAQGVQDNPGSSIDTSTPVSSVNETENTGINWLWLLPLLAVPLLFLVKRDDENEDRGIQYRDQGQFAGFKGGQASRRRDEEEDND